ncbi:hypothetical protein EES41_27865 [Streptomyces sp. ADI95-16]|uniref:hypothetical protein n=1 Tax=Streptomyces sp. ADI95-16 TaxID=1522758 RepID=UPI000F3A85D7|nr:hypothetical protein [Streptomyces sp. ADI95-16]AYV30543.1 hypothetical protein EES41_27865 [Streptomyces sp. ADI95-16]
MQSTAAGGSPAVYDRIGIGYRKVRCPDPRLAALIDGALGDARTVVNVGAGAGSYEPADREVTAVEPSQVTDGFQVAHWRRPESCLDPVVRAASSTLATLGPAAVEPGIARLRADLESGEWRRRHAGLLAQESVDYGYRLLIAGA